MSYPESIEFGWGAPKFKEQLPMLDESDADHFDKDNEAIIRLHLRGFITSAQRDAAIRKATKKIEAAVRRTISQDEKRARSATLANARRRGSER